MSSTRALLVSAIAILAGLGSVPPTEAVTRIAQFNPGLGSSCAVAFRPGADEVYVYACFNASIHRYSRAGTLLGTIPRPGVSSNDIDLEFTHAPLNLGGTVVPAHTLLVFNAEQTTNQQLFAVNPDTGALLAQVQLANPGGQLVGGAHHGTLYGVDWINDVVRVFNPETGAQMTSLPVRPGGSPAFDVFFGDLDVSLETGHLFVVSSSQDTIRELTPEGAFVQDIAVGSLGVTTMSGIAFDEGRGEAWIVGTNGEVYRLGGFPTRARGGFQVALTCPPTSRPQQTVTATATFRNGTRHIHSVTRAAVGTHAGDSRLSGPHRADVSASVTPGEVVPVDMPVLLPSARVGTLLSIGIGFFGRVSDSARRQLLGTDTCVIEIVR